MVGLKEIKKKELYLTNYKIVFIVIIIVHTIVMNHKIEEKIMITKIFFQIQYPIYIYDKMIITNPRNTCENTFVQIKEKDTYKAAIVSIPFKNTDQTLDNGKFFW